MEFYLPIIRIGLAFAPFIIIGLTIPFMLANYHRYGHLSFVQWFIVMSFAIYIFMVFAFALFPLPTIEEVSQLTTPTVQLQPFNSIHEFLTKSGFVANDITTYGKAMRTFVFLEPLLNIIFLMPFGVYLRYYFRKTWWQVILLSFALSLFLEVTQLTGIFWIYPRAYRIFDVDDLMANTFGGFLGFLIAPLLTWWLPDKTALLKHNYQKGATVSYFRRFVAYVLDWMIINYFILAVKISWTMLQLPPFEIPFLLEMSLVYGGIILFYFILLPYLTRGRTVGKWVVQIAISSQNHRGVAFIRLLLRQCLLYGLIVPSFLILLQFNPNAFHANDIGDWVKIVIPSGICCLLLVDLIYARLTNKSVLLYEKLSETMEVSTVDVPKKIK